MSSRCILVIGLSLLLLSGCASSPKTSNALRFNGVEILNLTNDDIRNMQIEVTKFHRKFACGIILHRSICMNGFHERPLESNEIVITWEQRGQMHSVGPVKVEAPPKFDPNVVYIVQFALGAGNRISASFKPATY